MTRPLASNDLLEAAKDLREHLARARGEAMAVGEPVLVRFDRGTGDVSFATWTSTRGEFFRSAASETEKDRALESDAFDSSSVEQRNAGSGDLNAALTGDIETWTLPENIELQAVSRTRRSREETEVERASDSGFGESRVATKERKRREEQALEDQLRSPEDSETQAPMAPDWIWFLPEGQGVPSEIILRDPRTQREVSLLIHGWNGQVEITRAQRRSTDLDATDRDTDGRRDERASTERDVEDLGRGLE